MVSSWRPENSLSAGTKAARRGIWVAAPLASLLVAAVATAEPTSPIAVAIPQRDLAPAIATSETPATPPLAPPEVTGFIQIRHQTVIDDSQSDLQKTGFHVSRALITLAGRLGRMASYEVSAAADEGYPERREVRSTAVTAIARAIKKCSY